eukprot:g17847.t1
MPRAKRNLSAADDDDARKEKGVAPEVQAVRKLFTEAQRTVQCHQRCSDSLPRLLNKLEAAWDEYFMCVSRILLVSKRDPGVERLVQFVALTAGSDVNGNAALFERTVEFLLRHAGAADKAVRFRCCQLLGSLTTEYTQRPDVSEDDLEGVVDKLLPRLRDKVAAVRVQAVGALRPFQFGLEAGDDEEALKEDRVRSELMRAMVSDSSPDVRQAALAAVTKTVGMFDQLVLRTQDVKESVRKAAFRTLGEDVASKHLHPQQRVTLIKRGLSDTSEAVVDACRFMLCAHWFRDVDYDPVELLQRLEVVGVEKVPELVVKEIVRLGLRADRERADPSLGMGFTLEDAKALRQAASRRIDLSSSSSSSSSSANGGGISAEEALYARVQAEVVKEDKGMSAGEKETRLEAILTDTTTLCRQIEANSRELKVLLESGEDDRDVNKRVFVLEQLLKLAAHADFSEEAGRRRLVTLLQNLLVDVNLVHHLVEPSMLALAAAHTSEADFVRVVAELVSDISDLIHKRQGGDTSVHNASLDRSLNASFASTVDTLGRAGGGIDGTPNRSFASMRSAVRAAIPKNFVKDRARAIEGMAPMAAMNEDVAGVGGSGSASKKAYPFSSEDEFMDAMSHYSVTDDDESSTDALRQVAAGEAATGGTDGVPPADDGEGAEDSDDSDVEEDLRRLFRVLDILSALLSKTKQTLAKDATLTAFEDVIIDVFKWTAEVLPNVCPDFHVFGPELREQAVETLGKYSLLGEAAAVRHCPMLLTIALCEHEATGVRVRAMQALSDLSLIFRSAVLGTTGDALIMFADVLKDRSANRGMIAVAAEAVSRLLFFELSHDPELLARLVVLYFEKGSAADPAASAIAGGQKEGSTEEEGGDEDEELQKDAKAIGSSVRLSQILGVYFRSLPSAGPRVRDMLSDSVRHVLRLLRSIAELNAAAEKNNQDAENEPVAMIDVPAHDVVRFVLELLMTQQQESGARAAGVASASATADGESSSPAKEEGGEDEEADAEKKGNEQDGTPEKYKAASSSSSKPSASSGENGVDATGHVALCITEELWALSGMDGVSDLFASLAKVLASLPLPDDDQVTLKRLRSNVHRLETLGDGRLGARVSRIIAKYAEILLAADLTPEDHRLDLDEDSSDDDDNNDDAEGNEQGEQREEELPVQQAPARKKRTSKAPPPPAPSRRPARQSKVAARERMAGAEAEAVAAAADEAEEVAEVDGSDDDDEEEAALEGNDEDDDDDEGDDSAATKVLSPTPAPAEGARARRRSSRAKAAPLSEISNSPVRA